MNWNYTIYAEPTGDATTIRDIAQMEPPTSFWAIGPPPGDESPGWVIALRFVVDDGYPVLAELRAFPDEGASHDQAHGEWSGDASIVPGLGLTASTIKNLSVKTMENQFRAALSNHQNPAWGDDQYPVLIDGEPSDNWDGEPSDNWMAWSEVTKDLEVDTTDTADRNKRGRKPHPDEHLAKVAYYYTEALRNGSKVHNTIRAKMRTGKKSPDATGLIRKARVRGFLAPAPKTGQKGGTLTPRAIAVLEASGFLDEQKRQSDKHEGDET
jgi:hypothetical protein